MTPITFITSNPSKAEQLGRHLDFPVDHKKLDIEEIQSLDLAKVAEYKAKQAYKILQTPVLVEDTGLTFHAMGKLPGPLIKWFLHELGNEGLCHLLNNYGDRSATAEVVFSYYDGKNVQMFTGEMKGNIARTPKGEKGFGWDPIFIPEGYEKTWGEMEKAEQQMTSIRRIALKKLEVFLRSS